MTKGSEWENVGILMIAVGGIGFLQGISHIMGIGEGSIPNSLLIPLIVFSVFHAGEALSGWYLKEGIPWAKLSSLGANSLVFGARVWVNGLLTRNIHSSEIAILFLIIALMAYILFKIARGI